MFRLFAIAMIMLIGVGGFFVWWYFKVPKEIQVPEEEVQIPEDETVRETTKWKEYILEKITPDFQSPDFMDRRLIGVRDDGQRDVITVSVKGLMGWEKIPGEVGFYPSEVSFPPHSKKIFFVKYLAGTGHSAGLFMLDVNTLEFKQLTEVGQIYENYLNYLSLVSPDGFKIASYGDNDLYLLDLLEDKAVLLVKAQADETFYLAAETPEFQWLENGTIQYPIHSAKDIYAPPIEIRQISIENVVRDETADWKTYLNPEADFTFQYPPDWEITLDTVYETAAGIRAKNRWVNLQRIGKESSEDWIRINPRQFQTSEGECFDINAGNSICTYSKDKEILAIIHQILSTFRLMDMGGPTNEQAASYLTNITGFGYAVERVGEVKEVEDVNEDGYSEFFITANGSGGSCVGGTNYKILYSTGDQEYFVGARSLLESLPKTGREQTFCTVIEEGRIWNVCPQGSYVDYACFSNNLKEKENAAFKEYLEVSLQ